MIERERRDYDIDIYEPVVPLVNCAHCAQAIYDDPLPVRGLKIHRSCVSGYLESLADVISRLTAENEVLEQRVRSGNGFAGNSDYSVLYTYTTNQAETPLYIGGGGATVGKPWKAYRYGAGGSGGSK